MQIVGATRDGRTLYKYKNIIGTWFVMLELMDKENKHESNPYKLRLQREHHGKFNKSC